MHQNRSSWQTAHKASSLAILEILRSSVAIRSADLASGERSEAAAAASPREAYPVGNTGITSSKAGNV